jgi:hypothetical protein
LCGGIAVVGKPFRLPSTIAATSAAMPALMWTTVPPAKSRIPQSHSRPPLPDHTMCAIGKYTSVTHSPAKIISAEKRMRSAIEPTISATVMIAKVIWKVANTLSGIAAVSESRPRPAISARSKPPITEFRLTTPCSMPATLKVIE